MAFFSQVKNLLERYPILVGVVLALLVLPLKIFGSELSYLNIHAARDWERGWQMLHFQYGWWHGPELFFRGTIPGYFFNILTGLFHIPTRNPYFAAMGPGILFAGSVVFFYDLVRRFCGNQTAIYSTLIYATFPLGTIFLRYLWNPSYLFLFTVLIAWFLTRAILEKRGNFLAGCLICVILAGQIHISAYLILLPMIVAGAVYRLYPSRRWVALVVLTGVCFYVPYLIDQWAHNWPDSASQKILELNDNVELLRYRLNPFAFQSILFQLVHQPNLEVLGIQRTFPFSYYDLYYRNSTAGTYIGMGAALFSILTLGAFFAGLLPLLRRKSLPVKHVAFVSLAWIILTSLNSLVWNPKVVGLFEDDFWVPIRYLIIIWPMQFVLVAIGIQQLSKFLEKYFQAFRSVIMVLLLAPVIIANVAFTIHFHLHAGKTGEPFQYTVAYDMPVHTMRDKLDLAQFLVDEYGVTEDILRTRVHTEGTLFMITEESIDFEIRSALENNPDHPEPDDSLYYFIYKPKNRDRIVGEYEEIETETFGPISVLVYRPIHDYGDFEVDAPISLWWD